MENKYFTIDPMDTRKPCPSGLGLRASLCCSYFFCFIGKGLFFVGKATFLTIAVPIYTVTYVLPKWIVSQAIPFLATWSWNSVIIPIAQFIGASLTVVVKAAMRFLELIYAHVLVPIAHAAATATAWTWNSVIIPTAQFIGASLTPVVKAAMTCLELSYAHVLVPIAQAVTTAFVWLWQAVIIPTYQAATAIGASVQSIALALMHATQETFTRLSRLLA